MTPSADNRRAHDDGTPRPESSPRRWTDLGAWLDVVLTGQIDRIRRRFFLHGSGWMVAAVCGVAILYYALDRSLHLPGAVRVLLTVAAVVYLIAGLRRRILYPLARPLDRADVAIALERRFPGLDQKLISAIQLKDAIGPGAAPEVLRNQSEAMIGRVIEDAAADARSLDAKLLLDPRRTLRVWGAGTALGLVTLLGTVLDPSAAAAFLQRVLGASVPYPRLTTLVVELPDDDQDFRITRTADKALVTLAAGADLPVLVSVIGKVPREVYLDVEGGRGMPPEVTMTKRAGDRFRHVFRKVHTDFTFHARGGDDDRGDLLVHVTTVHPPLVGTITTRLHFPAYTRAPVEERTGGAIEALEGTRVELLVSTTAPAQTAEMRFLDSDRRLALTPAAIEDDSGAGRAYTATFVVAGSDRYQIELVGTDGLRNPNPGSYAILALKDHGPVGRMLLPTSEDINVVVPGATVPVRIEAKDDFGLLDVHVLTRTGRSDAEHRTDVLRVDADTPPVKERIVTELVELEGLGGGGPGIGDSVSILARLTDNRAPEGSTTELSRRQIHVVDRADLARRIAGHFRRLREDVEKALDLQRERKDALEALLDEFPGQSTTAAFGSRLVAVEVGQGRILSAVQRIHGELMRSFNVHLFNRLEESIHAARVVEAYVRFHQDDQVAEPFVPGFYRLVADDRQEGRLGAMERTLDPILRMTMRADRIALELAPASVRALEAAGVADRSMPQRQQELLREALRLQDEISNELAALLSRLEEWNEYQDVIQQTRALRDQQKDVESRTRALQGERK